MSKSNLRLAFRSVKRNKGAAGIEDTSEDHSPHPDKIPVRLIFLAGLVEYFGDLLFRGCSLDKNLFSLHMLSEVVVGLVYVLGPWANLRESCQL